MARFRVALVGADGRGSGRVGLSLPSFFGFAFPSSVAEIARISIPFL